MFNDLFNKFGYATQSLKILHNKFIVEYFYRNFDYNLLTNHVNNFISPFY